VSKSSPGSTKDTESVTTQDSDNAGKANSEAAKVHQLIKKMATVAEAGSIWYVISMSWFV